MAQPVRKKVKVVGVHPLKVGDEVSLHDFQISASDAAGTITMVDFEIADDKESVMEDYDIKPGMWRVTPKSGLQKMDVPDEVYYETDTSKQLLTYFNNFVKKLSVYEKYKRLPKRSFLLGSDPGVGKSSCIRHFLRTFKDQNDICFLRVDTSDASWEIMTQMFMRSKAEDAKMVVLVIEDIGGTALEERRHHVQPDLLNFLDGNSAIYKIPTIVIATTNFLNELGPVLNDRPGRFDRVMHVEPPKDNETLFLTESFIGRELTETEKKALLGKKFSPAYCIEAIIRSELDDMTIEEAVDELIKQRDKSQKRKHGERDSSLGFGSRDEL